MVIDLLMDVTDLARVRFARSPMDELVHSVAVLGGRPGAEMHRTWVATTRPRLVGLDLTVLSALAGTRGFLPDFLMPPPATSRTTFARELERVRAATPEQVRRDLDRVVMPAVLRPLRDDPERELGKLVDQLRAYWEAALAPRVGQVVRGVRRRPGIPRGRPDRRWPRAAVHGPAPTGRLHRRPAPYPARCP